MKQGGAVNWVNVTITDCDLLALSRAWTRVGAAFSLEPASGPVVLENLVARTAAVGRSDARLFWVAASWLATHHALIDTRRMTRELNQLTADTSAIAGALFSVALEWSPTAGSLKTAVAHCNPVTSLRPLFSVVERHPKIVDEIRENALPTFLRWGFWQDEMTRKTSAVRPVRWILVNCPELRTRAILGPGLEAEILNALRSRGASASALSRDLGYRYASVHEAAERLTGRGLVASSVNGREHLLSITPVVQEWLS